MKKGGHAPLLQKPLQRLRSGSGGLGSPGAAAALSGGAAVPGRAGRCAQDGGR